MTIITGYHYPHDMIIKCCGKLGQSGWRFFKKHDKDMFIDFFKVLGRMKTAPQDFHSYYVLYKFHEFLDLLSIKEIALVCRVLNRLKINLLLEHPLAYSLKSRVENIICDNMETIDNSSLDIIDSYFPYRYTELFTRPELLQERALANKNIDVSSQILILYNVTNTYSGKRLSKQLLKKVLNEVNEEKVETLSLKDCSMLQNILMYQDLSSCERLAYFRKIEKYAVELMSEPVHSTETIFLLPMVIMQFLRGGIINERLFQELKNDERIFKVDSNGNLSLQGNVAYRNKNYQDKKTMVTLQIIFGLLKYYKMSDILVLSEKTLIFIESYEEIKTPSAALLSGRQYNHKSWSRVGSKIPDLILEAFGCSYQDSKEYIVETSVLPFYSTVDFIFCLDNSRKLVKIGRHFESFDAKEVKYLAKNNESDYHFINLTLILSPAMLYINGKVFDPNFHCFEIMKDLGYKTFAFHFRNDLVTDEEVLQDLKNFIENMNERLRDST